MATHNQSQATPFGGVTPLRCWPSVTHSFLTSASLPGFFPRLSVMLQSQLSFESVLICLCFRYTTTNK